MAILETERLLMRRLVPGDLDALYALYRDPDIRCYFPEGTLTLEETREKLEWSVNGHPDHSEFGLWATIHKATRQFIGRCGLLPWTIGGVDEVEIAYMIAKPYWRQGLGAEAAQGLVRYGFETLGLKRLIALIDPAHEASIRTAMQAGLRFWKEVQMDGASSAAFVIERRKFSIRAQIKKEGSS